MLNWPAVVEFITSYSSTDEVRSTSVTYMRKELARMRADGVRQEVVLKVQVAMLVDVSEVITKATYDLEGDVPLVSLTLASRLSFC